ncbi:MAG: hypothetical protein P1U63_00360 [Coxiellaceae bacterium]|nr:hypothetical protein [Coxiellaceae bacterium]
MRHYADETKSNAAEQPADETKAAPQPIFGHGFFPHPIPHQPGNAAIPPHAGAGAPPAAADHGGVGEYKAGVDGPYPG